MKHTFTLVITLASGLVLSAQGQTPAAPAAPAVTAPAGPAKIAVIAFQLAVAQTNEGQRELGELQKKFEPRQAELKATNDEIENLKKQLQTQAATLSDTERASRTRTIDEKTKQLQRSAQDLRDEGGREMQEKMSALASKVYEVLASYAQQQGYTLVLDVSQEQTPVLYAGDSTNITKAIIDAYNVKSGVAAPPQTAAAPRPVAPKPATAPAAKPAAH